MTDPAPFEIFLTGTPGLEDMLLAEVQEHGFQNAHAIRGGVTIQGTWPDVWRANLELRGATRVLARVGSFMAFHLAQLDKRSRKFPWGDILRPDLPVKVEVTTKKSKIYHAGAATQRIETALKDSHGMTLSSDAEIVVKVRIDDNRATISVDTTGESLHKRGHKLGIGKAPMRETLASLMLRQCGYDGSETVVDPMCGSGTFVIEAAEIALGLQPGRSRGFAFEQLASFDQTAFAALKRDAPKEAALTFYGSDRDAGAIKMSRDNAQRAGVAHLTEFVTHAAGELQPPDGTPGLVIVNPPYGGRIGNKKLLYPLYGTLGETLKTRFKGWRVGLVTSEPPLAKATGLPFKAQSAPIPHGGLKVWLFTTDKLG